MSEKFISILIMASTMIAGYLISDFVFKYKNKKSLLDFENYQSEIRLEFYKSKRIELRSDSSMPVEQPKQYSFSDLDKRVCDLDSSGNNTETLLSWINGVEKEVGERETTKKYWEDKTSQELSEWLDFLLYLTGK